MCTYNSKGSPDGECLATDIYLKWRAAMDFPGKGTVLMFECFQYEGPQDREEKAT